MKIAKNSQIKRVSSVFLGGALLLGGIASATAQVLAYDLDFRQIDPKIEKSFGVDSFDEEYSHGILYQDDSTKVDGLSPAAKKITFHGADKCTDRTDKHCGDNTEKRSDVYAKITNGAIYNNKYLDVIEYIWTDTGMWGMDLKTPSIFFYPESADDQTIGHIHREFHFYEAGTTTEVAFKGVIALSDFDWQEGYYIAQGYHQAYLNNPTIINYTAPNTWTTQGDADDPLYVNGPYMLWVEVQGASPKVPLILVYQAPEQSRGSSTIMKNVNYLTYHIEGVVPDGQAETSFDTVVQYGTVTPKTAKTIEGYTFDGWYLDEAMTQPAPSNLVITEDTNLYGKYTETKADVPATSSEAVQKGPSTPNTGVNNINDFDAGTLGVNQINFVTLAVSLLASVSGLALLVHFCRRGRALKF